MSRPRSPALIAALADITSGKLKPTQAGKLHGVDLAVINRARALDAAPVRTCPTCGHRVNPAKLAKKLPKKLKKLA